jgi:hypothetical protein
MIFGKNYRKIEFEDIERLVENRISESKTLDYKKEINLEKGDDKKEFLYDITSFVNSDGGVIIYGISELKDENGHNTGLPEEVCGIQIDNFEKLIQRIEDLIRSSVEPNIPDIVIKHLSKDNKEVLFIGLQKSTGLPCMVTYNSTNKFYRRRNTGKYLVDIYELNQMFMENIEIIKELESFRIERVKKIKNGEFISNVDPNKTTLIHICPASFYQYNKLSLTDDRTLNNLSQNLKLYRPSGLDYRSNFEGFLIFKYDSQSKQVHSYNQVFRNGIIEFFSHDFHYSAQGKNFYLLGVLELQVIEWVKTAISIYKELEVPPPFVIYITITDLLDHIVDINNFFRINVLPFSTNDLFLPNIIINDFDENIEKKLMEIFNIIWQAAGERKSPYFDLHGNRVNR